MNGDLNGREESSMPEPGRRAFPMEGRGNARTYKLCIEEKKTGVVGPNSEKNGRR